MTEWNVLNSVIVLIAGGCAIGVAVLVLLICVGAKRRKMSVRSSFVPIWSAERPSSQVRVLLSEHELEASFAMTPFVDPNEALRGWHDLRGRALGDDMCAQIEQLKQECDISYSEAMMRTQGTMEPRVLALRTSRHPHELHIGSLMVQTAYVIEKHALAVSSKLEREPLQDVPAYVRNLQSTLHLDKRLCEKYVSMYQRARWSGPMRSDLSMADLVQFTLFVSDLIADIDAATAV